MKEPLRAFERAAGESTAESFVKLFTKLDAVVSGYVSVASSLMIPSSRFVVARFLVEGHVRAIGLFRELSRASLVSTLSILFLSPKIASCRVMLDRWAVY